MRRGRPPKGEYAKRNAVLSTRISDDLKERLSEAASKNHRAISQEIENRLRESFLRDTEIERRFGSRQRLAIFELINGVINAQTPIGMPENAWLMQGYVYRQTLEAITAVLEPFRPPGDETLTIKEIPDGPHGEDWAVSFQAVHDTSGIYEATKLLRKVATAEAGLPSDPAAPDAEVRLLKNDLGALAGRLNAERIEAPLQTATAAARNKARKTVENLKRKPAKRGME